MKKSYFNTYAAGTVIGFLLGFIVIHPFSMVFQGMVHPVVEFDFSKVLDAFNPHHLPMAMFFGALGATIGCLIVLLIALLGKEKERVKILEGLLPICSYCKQIRDDTNTELGKGQWMKVENFISQKTDADFTHGICPECYKKVVKDIERISEKVSISSTTDPDS